MIGVVVFDVGWLGWVWVWVFWMSIVDFFKVFIILFLCFNFVVLFEICLNFISFFWFEIMILFFNLVKGDLLFEVGNILFVVVLILVCGLIFCCLVFCGDGVGIYKVLVYFFWVLI